MRGEELGKRGCVVGVALVGVAVVLLVIGIVLASLGHGSSPPDTPEGRCERTWQSDPNRYSVNHADYIRTCLNVTGQRGP